MRWEKTAALLRLARELASTGEGLTLDEMAAAAGVDRRTAERMRDALRDLFPTMLELPDGRAKRFRIPGGLDGFAQTPTPDELAELQAAIRGLQATGGAARATLLQNLSTKIQAALRTPVRLRLQVDVEALTAAEGWVMQAGPRPFADAQTLACLREAVKGMRACVFTYTGPAGDARQRRVVPYGLLFGRAYYLVGVEQGRESDTTEPKLWRLDRMVHLKLGDNTRGPPRGFRLAAFAAQSFGTFQEAPENIELRFKAPVAADARRFLFHPTQEVTEATDGSLLVRFRAGGLLELVRHLFAWGEHVEILGPQRLCDLMRDELRKALANLDATDHTNATTSTGMLLSDTCLLQLSRGT